jgi:hypothetical protein
MFMVGPFTLACAALVPPLICLIFAWIRRQPENKPVLAQWRGTALSSELPWGKVISGFHLLFGLC